MSRGRTLLIAQPGPNACRMDAIRVEGLTKRYGSVTAVDGLSFSVAPGHTIGLLGGNGAGAGPDEFFLALRGPARPAVRGGEPADVRTPL